MSTIQKVESKETEMISPINHTTMPSKKLPIEYIISNIQLSVITDPIDPKRVSKKSMRSKLTMSSAVKAVLVFAGTIGLYHLFKNVNVFSYFGWGTKNLNSKDLNNSEVMEVKNRENALTVRTNLKTTRQADSPFVNQFVQAYKDKDSAVKFKEINVEELKSFQKEN
jgi:hypothetical protein